MFAGQGLKRLSCTLVPLLGCLKTILMYTAPWFLFIKLSHFFIPLSLGQTLKTSPVWFTYYVSMMVAPKQAQHSRRQYSGRRSCPFLSIRPRGRRKMLSSQSDFLQPWGQAHRRHSRRETAGLQMKCAWKETSGHASLACIIEWPPYLI